MMGSGEGRLREAAGCLGCLIKLVLVFLVIAFLLGGGLVLYAHLASHS